MAWGLLCLEVSPSAEEAGDGVDDHEPDNHVPNAALGDVGQAAGGIVKDAFGPDGDTVLGAVLAARADRADDHALGANRSIAPSAPDARGLLFVLVAVEEIGFVAGNLDGVGDGHELGSAFAAELRRPRVFRTALGAFHVRDIISHCLRGAKGFWVW